MDPTNPFKWRHFEGAIILLCVRWYLRYSLSYRDLEEMMAERGLAVDHTTICPLGASLCAHHGGPRAHPPPPDQRFVAGG